MDYQDFRLPTATSRMQLSDVQISEVAKRHILQDALVPGVRVTPEHFFWKDFADVDSVEDGLCAQVHIDYEYDGGSITDIGGRKVAFEAIVKELRQLERGGRQNEYPVNGSIVNERRKWHDDGVGLKLTRTDGMPFRGELRFIGWRVDSNPQTETLPVALLGLKNELQKDGLRANAVGQVHVPMMNSQPGVPYLMIVRIDNFDGSGEWVRSNPVRIDLPESMKGGR